MATTFDPSPSSFTDTCPCGREHWITVDDSIIAIEYRCPECGQACRITFTND
jgi:hypothetical protein